MDTNICECFQLVFILTCQANHLQAFRFCSNCCIKYILTITRSRDAQEDITSFTQTIHLLGEDQNRNSVIHKCCSQRRFSHQRDSWKRTLQMISQHCTHLCINLHQSVYLSRINLTLQLKLLHQLTNNMFRIGCRTTITCYQ